MFTVTKFKMQNCFLKVYMRMTNFRCICTRRPKPQELCLLVLIRMNFVIFIWIFLDWIWISTFATMYMYICTRDMHRFKKKNQASRYVFQGGFYDRAEGVVCTLHRIFSQTTLLKYCQNTVSIETAQYWWIACLNHRRVLKAW